MDDTTIQLVRESFDLLEPIAPKAAALFTTHLIVAEPTIATLLKGDMIALGDGLMQLMGVVVARLDEPEVLATTLQTLGQRLATLGVRDAQVDAARDALLQTLRQCLGVAYTDEVEAAWLALYGTMATAVKEAAKATT